MAVKRWITISAAALGVASLGVAVSSATLWRPDDHMTATATTSQGVTVLTLDAAVPLQGGPNPLITVSGPGELVLVSAVRPDVQTWAVANGGQRVTALKDWETLGLELESLSDVPEVAIPEPEVTEEPTETPSDEPSAEADEPSAEDGTEDNAAQTAEPETSSAPDPRGLDLWQFETTAEGTLNIPGHGPEVQNLFLVASTGPEAGPLTISITWPVEVSTPLLWPGVAAGFLLLSVSGMLWLHRRREEQEQWVDLQLTGQIPTVDLSDEHSRLFTESLDIDQPSGWAPLAPAQSGETAASVDSAVSAPSADSAPSVVSSPSTGSALSADSAASSISAASSLSASSAASADQDFGATWDIANLPDDAPAASSTAASQEFAPDYVDEDDDSAIPVPGLLDIEPAAGSDAAATDSSWWQQNMWGPGAVAADPDQAPTPDERVADIDVEAAGEFGVPADFTGEIRQPNSEELDPEVLDYTQGGTPIYAEPVVWQEEPQQVADVVVPETAPAITEVPLTETGILRLSRRQRRQLEETGAIPILDAESYTPPTPPTVLSTPSAPSTPSAASSPSVPSAEPTEFRRISAADAPSEPPVFATRKERRLWETAQMAIIEVSPTGEIPAVPEEITPPEPAAESDIPELGPVSWRDAWAINEPADNQEEER